VRRTYRAGRIGIPATALLAILLAIPGLASTSLVRKSQEAYRAGNVALAEQRADDAVRAAPWSADAYMQRGLIFESQDRLTAAAADMGHAIDREPLNWRPQLLLSRIEAERGRVGPALTAFRSARHLRPKSPFTVAPPPQ
jgi:Tfp pilus assembly protein PilF